MVAPRLELPPRLDRPPRVLPNGPAILPVSVVRRVAGDTRATVLRSRMNRRQARSLRSVAADLRRLRSSARDGADAADRTAAPKLSLLLHGPVAQPRSRRVAALVEEHLPVADAIARSMTPLGQSREDFVQVARLALVEAAKRYDPERGVPFVGYAHPVVRGYLKHHLRDRCWAVRPPRRLQELWLEVHPARDRLAQRLGRTPTAAELSQDLREDPATIDLALSVQNAWAADSIDHAVETRREPAMRELGFDLIEDRAWLQPALRALPERLQLVIELRFVQEFTQQEIADRIGCSQMHISRLLAKALAELRRAAEAS